MSDSTISARIPEALDREIELFTESEQVDRSIAVRKLLSSGVQKWKEERALKLLAEGKATLSKAAKIAGCGIWEFAEKVKASGIAWVKLGPDDLKRELEGL